MSDDNMFDKIVEFGMGMTMVRQMPQMMDMAMSQQKPQGATTPPAIKSSVDNVYIANNGQQAGPFTEAEIKQLISNGVLTPTTLVWMPNMSQWAPANQTPAINKLFMLMATPKSSAPAPSIPVPPMPVQPLQSAVREDVVAALAQLGYSNAGVRKLVDDMITKSPSLSTEEVVKEVLKRL